LLLYTPTLDPGHRGACRVEELRGMRKGVGVNRKPASGLER
jgi:hypothetical protein